jgi:hypothetical protein
MNIPESYLVCTAEFRKRKDKTITVSGYKKSTVVATLRKSLLSGDVSRSIQWAVELHISGYESVLWNTFFTIMSKHIHRENPLLPVYMERQYRQHIEQLTVREPMNNQQSRNRIAEVTAVIALSHKCKIPIPKKKELQNIHKYQFAPSNEYSATIWKDDDLPEIRVACNELAFQLSKQDHTADTQSTALFWLHWLIQWDKKETSLWRKSKKKGKNPTMQCSSRRNKYILKEFATDYVWILWKMVLHSANTKDNKNVNIICSCLFRLFCHDYKTSKRSKNIMYLQHAVLLVLDTIPCIRFTQSVFTHYSVVIQSVLNINILYRDVHDSSKPHQRKVVHSGKRRTPSLPVQELPSGEPHPFLDYFMDNELYNDPRFNQVHVPEKEVSVLGHLDKFFSFYENV